MKRSSKIQIALIVGGGLGVAGLGTVTDRLMVAAGGDPIAANVYLLVALAVTALVTAVVRTDRNRDVPLADAGTRAQGLRGATAPGQAQVLVFRDDRMGARLGADVHVDGRLHTQLTSPGFTVIDLPPGPHRIVVEWQGQRVGHLVELAAGDVQALHVRMRTGVSTTTAVLEPVPAERARRLIGSAPMALPVTASA